MGTHKSLVGQRFGKLVVIKNLGIKGHNTMSRCQCDCGRKSITSNSHLLSGHTKSCGCSKSRREKLIGQKFGKLTVIEDLPTRKGNGVSRCRCDCGKEKIIINGSIKNGNTRSCGCLYKISNSLGFNQYEIFGDIVVIQLSQKKKCIIDLVDLEKVMKFRWIFNDGRVKAASSNIRMPRLILDINDRYVLTDHRDGNCLNNRRSNLRIATYSQNNSNRISTKNKFGLKGVLYNNQKNKYFSRIRDYKAKKYIHLGYFNKIEDAAEAYKQASLKLHGEFSVFNRPQEVVV